MYKFFIAVLLLPLFINAQTNDIVKGNTEFALNLYQQLSKNNPEKNLFFSPFSISQIMAITYAGTRKNTEKQIQKVFRFPNDNKHLHSGFALLNKQLKNNTDAVTLETANSLWIQNDYAFKTEYFDLVTKNYNALFKNVNFKKKRKRKDIIKDINSWVSDNTNNNIKQLITEKDISKYTKLVLINAIWFYGEWQTTFDEKKTKEAIFYAPSAKQKAPFMQQTGDFLYYSDDIVQAVKIPYKKNKQSMFILLPQQNNIKTLEKNLDIDYLNLINNETREYNVNIIIPKFTVDYSVRLKQTLQQMGMTDAFSNTADFSGLTDKNDLKIDKVIHKAKFEITEKGASAAAATAVTIIRKTAVIKTITFNANHPFIYFIIDNKTKTVLFMGRLCSIDS